MLLGFTRGLVMGLALIGLGWLGGSIYPAPQSITGPIASRVPNLTARLGIDEVTLDRLARFMSRAQLETLRNDAMRLASRRGDAIVVEKVEGPLEMQADVIEDAPAPATASGSGAFDAKLELCPGMSVSNAPAANAARDVTGYHPIVDVQGARIATAPTHEACLSSGFGQRSGRMHKGLDLHSGTGGPILAAGDGTVIERKYRDDYGNMLLIDHGNGVYTRYAHLSSFAPGVVEGATVKAGDQLGLMGNTAAYRIPIHLHYELLLGDYNNPRSSFGLTPHSPFEFPAAG